MIRRAMAALLLVATMGCGAAGMPAAVAQERGNSVFMSPAQEAEIGREQHEKVLAQFGGLYGDAKLQQYVTQLGERLKNVTPLKDQKFTFSLLNSDVVNAFALPGGYVYVTRGLLALARDEAELAGVLGHEIGHVVARHTAQRYDRNVWSQLGAVGAQVLGGLAGAWLGGDVGARLGSQVGGQGGAFLGQLYVQGFSREQEFEADELGVAYLQAAGYEPRAMASFLGQLAANDQLEARLTGRKESTPGWLRSHPRTADRLTRATEIAAADTPGAREQGRERFFAAIDGLVYGDDPAQGFVRGRTFEHPDLGFRFTAPPGFTLRNTPTAVLGSDRQGRIMNFDMGRGTSDDPETYLQREWVKQTQVGDVQRFQAGELDAAAATAQVQINKTPAEALLVAVEGEEQQFYRFVFANTKGLTRNDVADFESSARSFQLLAKGEASAIRPLRVGIHTVRSGDTQESVARMMEVEQLPLDTFRVLNGLQAGQELEPGQAVKVIVRG
jgi:predicted Zn-dependent protease